MRARTEMLALVVCGCAPTFPLDAVPILGATGEQEVAARDAIEAFTTWTGDRGLVLSQIEFTSIDETMGDGGVAGSYDHVPRDVEIESTLEATSVGQVIVHELCHALDRQTGLLRENSGIFATASTAIMADDTHPLHPALARDDDERFRRSEVLATLCEQFPLGTHALAHPCDGDPDEYRPLAAWVNTHVWTAQPDITAAPVAPAEPVTWTAPFDVDRFLSVGARDRDVVVLATLAGDDQSTDYLRTTTAEATDDADSAEYTLTRSGPGTPSIHRLARQTSASTIRRPPSPSTRSRGLRARCAWRATSASGGRM